MKRDQLQPLNLLVVEDSDEDFEALSRIIARVNTLPLAIYRCVDGDDAWDFLNQAGKYHNTGNTANPDLIVLDLNLPGTDGREVIATLKQSKTFQTIPVVVFSTSSNPKDIEACYQSGVNSYMLKPMKINEMTDAVRMMLDYWFKATVLPTAINS